MPFQDEVGKSFPQVLFRNDIIGKSWNEHFDEKKIFHLKIFYTKHENVMDK